MVPGFVPRPGESLHGHYSYGVTGDYFAALDIPLRAGRFIGSADVQQENRVTNETTRSDASEYPPSPPVNFSSSR